MADTCCVYTYGGLSINALTGDCLLTDWDAGDVEGLDGGPIRKTVDPRGQISGGIVHPAFLGPRIVRFTGVVLVRSVDIGDRLGFAAAVNVVTEAWRTGLEALLNAPTTLAWTPNGMTAHTLSATYGTEGGEFTTSGPMLEKKFSLTLVAEDPTISVA